VEGGGKEGGRRVKEGGSRVEGGRRVEGRWTGEGGWKEAGSMSVPTSIHKMKSWGGEGEG
jgi:hypothetical protein